jgi:hypothetical protein
MGTEMVNLYVGPQRDRFHVHKEVLCSKIPYFEKSFYGRRKEATFPKDDTDSFDFLLGWVYHNSIRPLVVLRKEGPKGNESSVESWDSAKFYMLAVKLSLSDLQDQIVNIYINYMDRENLAPSVRDMGVTYSTMPAGKPFRKFAARSFHWALDPSSTMDNTVWPTHALADLLRNQDDLAEDVLTLSRAGVKSSDPKKLPRCEFHNHGKDEPYPTKKDGKASEILGEVDLLVAVLFEGNPL